jgi:2-phosphosulfolactate phosphatase
VKLLVFFSPADVMAVKPAANDIYIVIDVIRATTSLATIFDQGAARVLVADTVEQARMAAKHVSGRLLCGERHALPLPGFDYGNSPAQFSRADIDGRELVLTTTNGTRAFFACPEQSVRLAGCFYNAHAVTAYALARAQEQGGNVALVCAAEAGYFALDDAACAGYLAHIIREQQPAIEQHESALAAVALHQSYPPELLIKASHSAQHIIAGGLAEDLNYCMRIDASQSVPRIVGREAETGLLVLENASINT